MKNKIIARNLFKAAKGYGMSEAEILKCLNSIPYAMVDDFVYTMYRIADKSGPDGFDF